MAEAALDEKPKVEVKPRVRVIKTYEREIEQINGDVWKHDYTPEYSAIYVGNTGLKLDVIERNDAYVMHGHFMPAGFTEEGYVDQRMSIMIFGFGLKHLRDWFNSTNEMDMKRIDKVDSITNPVFGNFLQKFFTQNGHGELITNEAKDDEDVQRIVKIDIRKLLDLSNDDLLVRKIEAVSKKAEGLQISVLV